MLYLLWGMLYLAFRLAIVTILYQLYLNTQLKSGKIRNPKILISTKKSQYNFEDITRTK